MAYATAGTPTDLNKQVNQLAQMALQSGDHMGFFQKYLTSSNPNRLAAQLAQGMVQQQVQGAETQKNLNQPQPPTVLDGLEQQQGMAAMPTARGMFNPDVYAQGGIGAGLGEEPQGQAQMARGGVVAFAGSKGSLVSPEESEKLNEWFKSRPQEARINYQEAEPYRTKMNEFQGPKPPDVNAEDWEARKKEIIEGNKARDARIAASEASRPGPTQPAEPPAEPPAAPTKEQLKAEKQVTKLDAKIDKAEFNGKDTTNLREQRARLTEGINAGRTAAPAPAAPAPAAPAGGLTLETPAQAQARTSGINAGRPAATVAGSGIAGPGAPSSVQAVTAPPAPAAPAGGGVPPQAPPPGATAAPAAPGTPPPAAKPGTLRYDLDRLKAAAAKARTKIPTPWQAVKGVGRGLGTAGLLYGTGQTAYDITNAGIDALDTEGNFRNSVSNSPFFQSAEAEQAAQNLTKPVPQSEIDAYRKQRLAREGVEKGTTPVSPTGGYKSREEFIGSVMPWAEKAAKELNVPAEAIANQWALETGNGKSIVGKFNYGNIQGTYTGKSKEGTDAGNKRNFVEYGSMDDFAKDYVKQLKNPKRYNLGEKPLSAEEFYTRLKKHGYAEDPDYVAKLMKGQPQEKGVVGRAVDFAAQTPRNAAVAMGADPNAAEAIPQTRQEWVEHLQRSLSPGQLLESGRTGLNAARMGTANAMEAMFGAKPDAAPALKPTAQEQYAEMMKNQAAQQAPAEAAPKDNKLFGLDRDRIAQFLFHSGVAGLANPSQHAFTSLGKGWQSGLTADEAQQAKLAERAAKAEEGAKNRAEKQYEARQKSAATGVKGLFPDPERSVVEIDTLVNYAALKGMSPMARRVNGFDDATYKELEKTALKLMQQLKGAPAAGDKGKPPSDNWGQIQKSGG